MYVLVLYVEGGEYDGETFVVGPMTNHAAEDALGELGSRGQVQSVALYPSVDELLEVLT